MQYHKLKTWPEFFDAVKSGEKTFEVRKNDRHFQVGDWLCLMKFDPDKNIFLGDTVTLKVLYILPGGLPLTAQKTRALPYTLRHGGQLAQWVIRD